MRILFCRFYLLQAQTWTETLIQTDLFLGLINVIFCVR